MKNLYETWTPILGFEDYHINKLGDIFSCLSNKIIKQRKSNTGYFRVCLYKDGKCFVKSVHRLMCETFLKNDNNYNQVNHIDGIKSNNNLDNLEWISGSDNIKHAYRNGLRNLPIGESNSQNKLSEKDVIKIKKELVNYKYGMTAYLGRKYNVCQQTISNIKCNKTWKHI